MWLCRPELLSEKWCLDNDEGEENVFKVMIRNDSQFSELLMPCQSLCIIFIKHDVLTCSLPVQPSSVLDGTFIFPSKWNFMLQSDVDEDSTYIGMMLIYLAGQTMDESNLLCCFMMLVKSLGTYYKFTGLIQKCSLGGPWKSFPPKPQKISGIL